MTGRFLASGHIVTSGAERFSVVGVLRMIEHELLLPFQCAAKQRFRFRAPARVQQNNGQIPRKNAERVLIFRLFRMPADQGLLRLDCRESIPFPPPEHAR